MDKKEIAPTDRMVRDVESWGAVRYMDDRELLRYALNHPDAAGLFECDHTDYVHVDEAATRVEAAREQGWGDAAQWLQDNGWSGWNATLRMANPHRPEREGAPTMSTPTEPNMQIIENATRKDVRPGDHVVFRHTWKRDGLAVAERREGIAHHLDDGNWCTEAGMYITLGVGEDVTITIRRAVQELPTEDGAVIVPADGRKFIETQSGKKSRRLTWDAECLVWYDARGTHLHGDITPGTWKVEGE